MSFVEIYFITNFGYLLYNSYEYLLYNSYEYLLYNSFGYLLHNLFGYLLYNSFGYLLYKSFLGIYCTTKNNQESVEKIFKLILIDKNWQ